MWTLTLWPPAGALLPTGASPRPGLATKTPPLASFFGFRSRTLTFSLVSFLCAILFFLAIYFGLFGRGVVSVKPKGNWRPPLTSFSGIRSSRRINLSLVRLRLLLSDSAAGASFLFFGVFTLFLSWYQHPCQVAFSSNKGRAVHYVCCSIRGIYAGNYFSAHQNDYSLLIEIPTSLLCRLASDLDQWCFIFEHVSEIAGESRARNTE